MKKQTRFILFAFLVVLLLAVTAVAASAGTVYVSSQDELQSAVNNAQDGDVITITNTITNEITISGDITFERAATYTVQAEPGVTVTLEDGCFLITAGNVTFSGGTFIAEGNVLFDIALRADKGEGFEITGGTYILAGDESKGGALLRTRVGLNAAELGGEDDDWYADPTKLLYLNDVVIQLSGGVFVDQRKATMSIIDATVSNAGVEIGNNAVLLSLYAKNYIVDINNERSEAGEDIPFAQNTVLVQYKGSNYHCYKAYEGDANTVYSPVSEGVSVALEENEPGLLFFSTVPSSVVKALEKEGYFFNETGKDYTIGTLIAPADYVVAAGGFTHAKLDAWGERYPAYVDIQAKESIIRHEDDSIDFNGGLIYLKSCERAYAAVAYVKVNGTYYYSTYDVTKNAHTMADISKIAYTDYSATQSGDYQYKSVYKPDAYSEFTADQQQLLQSYCNYYQTLTTATVTPAAIEPFGEAENNLQEKANALAATLRSLGYDTSGMPLLVGTTGATVKQALAKVEGYGYYIGVIGEQIVIAGSNDALTMLALSVFEEICKEANGAPFDLTEIVASNVPMVMLNWETPIVYSHTRDTNAYNVLPQYFSETTKLAKGLLYSGIAFRYSTAGKPLYNHLYNTEDNELTLVEYPLYAAMQIGERLDGNSGYNSIYVPDSFAMSGGAIHVGLTDLARKLLRENDKDVGYYGYFVEDGKIVVTSYDDATLRLALKMFLADLDDYALDVDGADVYALPADFKFENGKNNGFTADAFDSVLEELGEDYVAEDVGQLITDYPRPDLPLSGAVNVSNGELELYYLGATVEDYHSYCDLLEQNYYEVYMTENPVEGSYFVTYVNRDANKGNGIMLHVMYNAYTHASTQVLSEGTKLDAMFTPTLRVISSTIEEKYEISYVKHILPEEFLTKKEYKKITDSKLTVVQRADGGKGCYIYTLEDGSFVVVDGGEYEDDFNAFYNVLKALYAESHNGTEPTSENPICIAAWYLTHSHDDHSGLLYKLVNNSDAKKYLGTTIRIDGIISNFPSNDEIYNAHTINQREVNLIGTSKWFKGTSKDPNAYVPYYNVHTGQKFFVGNLEFEVMFTPEDIHPWATATFNDACTVIRLTVHAHDVADKATVYANTTATSKVSTMALGDIYPRTSKSLRATYGDYLESDIMMNAHHGTGGEGELYQLINPQIILWQSTASAVRSKTKVNGDRFALENLEMIKNTRWRYIISSCALSITEVDYTIMYNPTIKFSANGVAGLGKATTHDEVEAEAEAFRKALTNPGGTTDELFYGEDYFVNYDYSKDKKATAYSGEGYLLWRGNYFSDTTLPDEPDEKPDEPDVVPDDVDGALDEFGKEIELPEIQ